MSADDGITCEEDLPLHRKGEELRRGRMEHNFQRRAARACRRRELNLRKGRGAGSDKLRSISVGLQYKEALMDAM